MKTEPSSPPLLLPTSWNSSTRIALNRFIVLWIIRWLKGITMPNRRDCEPELGPTISATVHSQRCTRPMMFFLHVTLLSQCLAPSKRWSFVMALMIYSQHRASSLIPLSPTINMDIMISQFSVVQGNWGSNWGYGCHRSVGCYLQQLSIKLGLIVTWNVRGKRLLSSTFSPPWSSPGSVIDTLRDNWRFTRYHVWPWLDVFYRPAQVGPPAIYGLGGDIAGG